MTVSLVIGIVLAGIAALHLYWGVGGRWPGTDEESCARAVVGFKGVRKMPPPPAAFGVTLALVAAAWIALALGNLVSWPLSPPLLALAGIAAGIVFLARGMAGFTPAWRRLAPELPFARNDVRYFSPLCLLLGVGFVFLVFRGLLA